MDYSSKENLDLLRDCSNHIHEVTQRCEQLYQENVQLRYQLELARQGTECAPAEASLIYEMMQNSNQNWYEECRNMQSSLSWRITKPLRLLKKVIHSIKVNGFVVTIKKITYAIRKVIYENRAGK